MYITNKCRTDGFGAQYQTIIFTMLFAHVSNLKFVYTPFCEMEHNYDNDPSFIEKKEMLINIKNTTESVNETNITDILDIDLPTIYQTVENNLDFCLRSKSFELIKRAFFDGKKNPHIAKTASLHIRRPNPHDIGDYGYTDDQYFMQAIKNIRKEHPDIECIKIFSQGCNEDFEVFLHDDVELHLNLPIEETFINLAYSDVLVMSKSSFSYTAALLCEGTVYYLPFWHKPSIKWKNI